MRLFHVFFLTIALWATLFLPGLGDTELKGEEGRRILPAREMLRRDNYVLPYSEGKPYHRKPPGINWAIAASFKLTGVQNEWTARLPSVLAVLALALTGVWAGMKLRGPWLGLALGIALLVNGGMLEKARLAEIESLYVSLAGIGMLAWAANWGSQQSSWKVWLATVIPFALANLVKGPVYLVFFYPIVLIACRQSRTGRQLLHPAHLTALVLALAPMIIWGILVKQQLADVPLQSITDDDGNEILVKTPGDVWWQQISGRLSFANINFGDWAQLPLRVLLLLAPWPLLAWFVTWKSPSAVDGASPRWEILRRSLGWGVLLSIGLFCLLPATRARYLMPALAPCVLWAVMTIFSTTNVRRLVLWDRLVLGMFILASLAGVIAPWFVLAQPGYAFALNVVFIALTWFWWHLVRRVNHPTRSFALTAFPFLVLSILLATTVLPRAKLSENVRPTATAINALATEPGSIVAIQPGPQPFLFYLGERCAEASKISDFPEDTAYVLMPPKLWNGDSETLNKLVNRRFTKVLALLKDQRFEDGSGREYLLIGREPAADSSTNSTNSKVP